jgi:hypothetical protein
MKLFDYCFYRIHSVYIHKKIDKHPRIYACGWTSFSQLCNMLSVVLLFCFVFNLKYDFKIIILTLTIGIYVTNYFFLLTEKKYKELTKKYKEEKNKKLKGWLVFLYIFGSLLLYNISLFVFKIK